MIVILRQVVVGWEVLLIEVQAVALSALKPNFSCPYHWSLRRVSRCNTEGMRGGGGGGFHLESWGRKKREEVWHHGGLQGGCGEGEEDSCYRTSWVGTGTALAWVSQGGLGTGQS